MLQLSKISLESFDLDQQKLPLLKFEQYRDFFKQFVEILPLLESNKKVVTQNPDFITQLVKTGLALLRRKDEVNFSEEQLSVCKPDVFPITFATKSKYWIKVRKEGKKKEKDEKDLQRNSKNNKKENNLDFETNQTEEDSQLDTTLVKDALEEEDFDDEDKSSVEDQSTEFKFLRYPCMVDKFRELLLKLAHQLRVQNEKLKIGLGRAQDSPSTYQSAKNIKAELRDRMKNLISKNSSAKAVIALFRFVIELGGLRQEELDYYEEEVSRIVQTTFGEDFKNLKENLIEFNRSLFMQDKLNFN